MRGAGITGRVLTAVLGVIVALLGLAAFTMEGEAQATGVWLVIVGLVLIVAAIVERRRYRSETAERSGLPIGPGGGEPSGEALDGRFRRTDEVFVDPTSDRRMRVWLDSTSGERRYVAED